MVPLGTPRALGFKVFLFLWRPLDGYQVTTTQKSFLLLGYIKRKRGFLGTGETKKEKEASVSRDEEDLKDWSCKTCKKI